VASCWQGTAFSSCSSNNLGFATRSSLIVWPKPWGNWARVDQCASHHLGIPISQWSDWR
jgi:hypothetical protein